MPIEFRPLSMMDLRKSPGEILDRVAHGGEAFIVERSGQQMACLVPLSTLLPEIQQSRLVLEFDALERAGEVHRTAITPEREIDLEFRHEIDGLEVHIRVHLPHGYPNNAPQVFAAPLEDACPHRWQDGSLCIFGVMEVWNPGKHNIVHVVRLARRWLNHYAKWRRTDRWPQPASERPTS